MKRLAGVARTSFSLALGLVAGAIVASCTLLTPTGDLEGGEPSSPGSHDAGVADATIDQASDATVDHAAPPHCSDKVKDLDETDVDCGGSCMRCLDGRMCKGTADCQSGDCFFDVCAPASCTDGVKNGAETDVDCGGGTCKACANGKDCATESDCQNLLCEKGVCAAASCTDKIKDGAETDVDCGGGTCPQCVDERSCVVAEDCASDVCAPDPNMSIPKSQPCDDGKTDGTETDVDCGGGLCKACGVGKKCVGASDCASGQCVSGTCKAACGQACAGPNDCLTTCACNLTKKLCGG